MTREFVDFEILFEVNINLHSVFLKIEWFVVLFLCIAFLLAFLTVLVHSFLTQVTLTPTKTELKQN